MVICSLSERILPFARPVVTAAGTLTRRLVWIVAIQDEAGHVGLGEAAPLPAFGGEDPVTCREVLQQVMPRLDDDLVLSWLTRARPDAALGRIEPLLADAPGARSAVEGALIDLLAQRSGVPVCDLLRDGQAVAEVPVNLLLSGATPMEVMRRAQDLAGLGATSFKLKVGGDPRADIDRVCALREIVGPEARLRVDANGAWTAEQAQAFLVGAREARLEFCEQPLPSGDLAGLAALRKQSGVPLAVDESIRAPADVGRIAAAQAADLIVLKPMLLGGWRPTLQAAQLAQSQGIEPLITTTLDGSVGRAHATHMAAALGLTGRAPGLAPGELLAHDLTSAPLAVEGGAIHLARTPGIGVGEVLPPPAA